MPGVRAAQCNGTVHCGILESSLDKVIKNKESIQVFSVLGVLTFKRCATLPTPLNRDPASEFPGSSLLPIPDTPSDLELC